MSNWFTRPLETQTIPRQQLSLTQQTEARLVQNIEEMQQVGRELAEATEEVKTGIPKLLAKRENLRVRHMNLQSENSRLKAELRGGRS